MGEGYGQAGRGDSVFFDPVVKPSWDDWLAADPAPRPRWSPAIGRCQGRGQGAGKTPSRTPRYGVECAQWHIGVVSAAMTTFVFHELAGSRQCFVGIVSDCSKFAQSVGKCQFVGLLRTVCLGTAVCCGINSPRYKISAPFAQVKSIALRAMPPPARTEALRRPPSAPNGPPSPSESPLPPPRYPRAGPTTSPEQAREEPAAQLGIALRDTSGAAMPAPAPPLPP